MPDTDTYTTVDGDWFVDGILFPGDYTPVPAMLGDKPVTLVSATAKYALIRLYDGSVVTTLVSRLHR